MGHELLSFFTLLGLMRLQLLTPSRIRRANPQPTRHEAVAVPGQFAFLFQYIEQYESLFKPNLTESYIRNYVIPMLHVTSASETPAPGISRNRSK